MPEMMHRAWGFMSNEQLEWSKRKPECGQVPRHFFKGIFEGWRDGTGY